MDIYLHEERDNTNNKQAHNQSIMFKTFSFYDHLKLFSYLHALKKNGSHVVMVFDCIDVDLSYVPTLDSILISVTGVMPIELSSLY